MEQAVEQRNWRVGECDQESKQKGMEMPDKEEKVGECCGS